MKPLTNYFQLLFKKRIFLNLWKFYFDLYLYER